MPATASTCDPTLYNPNSGSRWEIISKLDYLLAITNNANIKNPDHYCNKDNFANAIKLLQKMTVVMQIYDMDACRDYDRGIRTALTIDDSERFIVNCYDISVPINYDVHICDMIKNSVGKFGHIEHVCDDIAWALHENFEKFIDTYRGDRRDDGYSANFRDKCNNAIFRDKSDDAKFSDAAITAVYAYPILVTLIKDMTGTPYKHRWQDLKYESENMQRVIDEKIEECVDNLATEDEDADEDEDAV